MSAEDDPAEYQHSNTENHVRRARAGDGEGFADLFERLAQSLDTWAALKVTGSLRDFMEPHDLVQETWWRAMDAFPRFDPQRSGFRPWLFTIAQNVLLESYRSRRRAAGPQVKEVATRIASLPPDLARQATSVSQRFMLDEAVRAFVAEVATMEDQDRQVLVHMGIEGLTASESADLIGLELEATKKRWQRLRARLRENPTVLDVEHWAE